MANLNPRPRSICSERLENRTLYTVLLIDDVLCIDGTSGRDLIGVTEENKITVDFGGVITSYTNHISRIVIRSFGGDDIVDLRTPHTPTTTKAGGGNDTVFGGLSTDDIIFGGQGDDQLFGRTYSRVSGEGGDDEIFAGYWSSGGEGNDFMEIIGSDLTGPAHGGPGDDRMWATVAAHQHTALYGDEGNDQLSAAYPDVEVGGASLYGGMGDDVLTGDFLFGGAGKDYLQGLATNDLLEGGEGADTLAGGPGNDTMYGHDGPDLFTGGAGDDEIYGNNGRDTIRGGAGNDFLTGNVGYNVIYGGDGNDILRTIGGLDTLIGGPGNNDLQEDHEIGLL